jgi:hypothetical protein
MWVGTGPVLGGGVVPTGVVAVPAGGVAVPAGLVLAPAGEVAVPPGIVVVPPGGVVAEDVLVPKGDDFAPVAGVVPAGGFGMAGVVVPPCEGLRWRVTFPGQGLGRCFRRIARVRWLVTVHRVRLLRTLWR